MESPKWRLEVTSLARRDLKQLSPTMRDRVVRAIDGLTTVPRVGDIKKLKGARNEYRLRVGDWRVIYRLDDEQQAVVILAVPHRSDAYRD
jgi:mRNA interferase RelE/StbE